MLLTVVAAAGPADDVAGASLVALLAALGPVIRAGFEWARLLYFDLVRLGLPLLADLRRRFDRAVLRLALLMGAATWLIAAVVGVVILGIREAALLGALVPFFVARSVLAAAQMRAFAGAAYRRLTLVGLGGLAGFAVALWLVPGIDGRLLALAAVLAVSAVLLIALPDPAETEDRVLPLVEWLASVRDHPGPVTLTVVTFDDRALARGDAQGAARDRGMAAPAGRPARGITAAELRVLQFLPSRLTFRQIGEHLFLSQTTIKTHSLSIYRKLGVSSRDDAVARAQSLGLVEAPPLA